MANIFDAHNGPVSGLKPQAQAETGAEAEVEGHAVDDRKPTRITVQFHVGTAQWTATLDGNGSHTFTFPNERAVKRFINDIYRAEERGRFVVYLEAEPRPEPLVAVSGYAQVSPHPYGYYFCVSVYSDLDGTNLLPGQEYTGTTHSLGDALTYVGNVVTARNLRRMKVDIRTNDPTPQSAYEGMWTTEELSQREG